MKVLKRRRNGFWGWSRITAVLVLALLLFPSVAMAASARADETVTVPAGQTVNDDLYAAGESVLITGTVAGNLIAAGSKVTIEGTVTGDVWAIAGEVTVLGTVGGSLRSAGSTIDLAGRVGGDVLAAGNSLTVRRGASVARDVWAAGDRITLDGTIGRNLKLAAERGQLGGSIGGAAEVSGDEFRLGPGSRIGGNLRFSSENDLSRDPSAIVGGTVDTVKEKAERRSYADRLSGQIFWFLASVLLLFAMLLYARRAVLAASLQLTQRPGWAALSGLIFLIAGPLAMFFLLLTLVGIPLMVISLGLYLLVAYSAKIFVAVAIGRQVLRSNPDSLWRALAAGTLGLAFFYLLLAVPVVGWLVGLLTVVFGVGAQVLLARDFYGDLRKKYGS